MAKGIIAAGHQLTLQAAEEILNEGGNAFDAAIAAFYAACVVEPVLASPGGGGFLLAQSSDQTKSVYDFFVQTPKNNSTDGIDFLPIEADFGEVKQEFHIGQGSIATPGAVRGMFDIHRDLASMPMAELVQPALDYAKQGIECNDFQSYILQVVSPIFLHSKAARKIFCHDDKCQVLLRPGDVYRPVQLADTLEAIAIEGDRLFYEGEIASYIVNACQSSGGLLTQQDLSDYRCIKRKPLQFKYKNCHIITNPPPSSGGVLIAFAMNLLQNISMSDYAPGSLSSLKSLALVMELTQKARIDQTLDMHELHNMLDEELIQQYAGQVRHHAESFRGTTHISIIDDEGNMAALTLSNGEGCGSMLADTGIMLNNMLGEQDLNPHGFFKWQADQRMTSMMAPSMMRFDDGRQIVTGSGGSNRIRTALMQVMVNLIDYAMPIEQAVCSPRLHLENGELNIEGQFSQDVLTAMMRAYPQHQLWSEPNLFFGGAHSVMRTGKYYSGVGDIRRGGVCSV